MPEEPFLLVSLKEKEAKDLAQVISSNTCRKILDALSKSSATETQLSESLKQPLSTIHYNIQLLLKSKLIKADEFHYSEKGKEVLHYSLSNKYVIIAPKEATESFRDKLKRILPFVAIILAATAVIQFFNRFRETTLTFGTRALQVAVPEMVAPQAEMLKTVADSSIGAGAPLMLTAEAANETANAVTNITTTEIINTSQQIVREPLLSSTNIALWFLIGAIFAGIIFVIIYLLTRKK